MMETTPNEGYDLPCEYGDEEIEFQEVKTRKN
jgi:hypothetical protein